MKHQNDAHVVVVDGYTFEVFRNGQYLSINVLDTDKRTRAYLLANRKEAVKLRDTLTKELRTR